MIEEEELQVVVVGAQVISSSSNNSVNKNREQLFDYYTNLEKNLETVRAEIDKLKQEAFEDLAYINNILVAENNNFNNSSMISGGQEDEEETEEQVVSMLEKMMYSDVCGDGDDDLIEMKLADEFEAKVGRIEEEIRGREMKLMGHEVYV